MRETKAIFKGERNGKRLYEVRGVVLDAKDQQDAIRKYFRKGKKDGK